MITVMHILLLKEVLMLQNQIMMVKKLALESNAPFNSCMLKINNTLIDNAEDLEIVVAIYILIEYIKNYSKTTGSLWNYYRDEPNSGAVGNISYSIKDSKYFDYKTSITERLVGNNTEKEVEIVVPLKHLSKFWRTLDVPKINCEIILILTPFAKQQEMLTLMPILQ